MGGVMKRIFQESRRKNVSDNNMTEQKSILVVRAPLSSDGFVSIHFSSAEGRLMNEKEWWHFTLRHEPYPETYFDFPVR